MRARTRRRISLFIVILVGGFLFYLAVLHGQKTLGQHGPQQLPLTLKERLLRFIPEEEMVLDHSTPGELVLLWQDVPIKLGRMENISQKVTILKTLFPVIQTRQEQIEYVDVRFPENVVIKYHET